MLWTEYTLSVLYSVFLSKSNNFNVLALLSLTWFKRHPCGGRLVTTTLAFGRQEPDISCHIKLWSSFRIVEENSSNPSKIRNTPSPSKILSTTSQPSIGSVGWLNSSESFVRVSLVISKAQQGNIVAFFVAHAICRIAPIQIYSCQCLVYVPSTNMRLLYLSKWFTSWDKIHPFLLPKNFINSTEGGSSDTLLLMKLLLLDDHYIDILCTRTNERLIIHWGRFSLYNNSYFS